jgi:uncharacterized membrane protein YqaE (UPF0057 family)
MRKINQLSVLVLLALVTLSACTMQKRVYNRGFHLEWFESKGSDKVAAVHAKKAEKKQSQTSEQTLANKTETAANVENMDIAIRETKTVMNAVEENNNNVVSAPKVFFKSTKMAQKALSQKSNTFAKPVMKAAVKQMTKPNKTADTDMLLLYILCIFIPPIAVGLATDWDATPVISNILWCLLCGLPGIIHAFIVVNREA